MSLVVILMGERSAKINKISNLVTLAALTWMLSCWQWRWPRGTSCGRWAGPRPGPLPAAQRNAGIWPQSGAGRRKSGSRFLKKRGSNCDLSAYIVCVCSLCIPCLPSAPVLGMLAVLAALVTAWVFYQINMLGWSAQGLERLLYFQLLFVSCNNQWQKNCWHLSVCCLLLVWWLAVLKSESFT